MYSIEYSREAAKVLAKMPKNLRLLLGSKIEELARDPFSAANIKALVGRPGYRLRVGDWRVIHDIDSERIVVRVLRVGSRGGVYE